MHAMYYLNGRLGDTYYDEQKWIYWFCKIKYFIKESNLKFKKIKHGAGV
jgi:hypothetical protein